MSAMLFDEAVLSKIMCFDVGAQHLLLGGIADGCGLAAALALGAVGAQIGIALMATKACEVSPAFKEMMVRARETDTYLPPWGKAGSRRVKTDFVPEALRELTDATAGAIRNG